MSVQIRIIKKTHPLHTGGAVAKSPIQLISGTAVPALMLDVNTATLFDGIIVSQIAVSAVPATKRRSRRDKRVFENRVNFDMIPAYAVRQQAGHADSLLLRAVNTPLAKKAEEEMSDFEREYPW